MGKVRAEIDDAARRFIEAQKIFFVASAPLDPHGHVNLSPKGLDTFRILDPTTVAYLDFNGSGVETIAHLKEKRQNCPDVLRLPGTTKYPAFARARAGSRSTRRGVREPRNELSCLGERSFNH